MRQLRYGVATSVDGFIAGLKGEFDWIVHDPAIDFAAMYRRFDTFLMGRRTFELAKSQGPMLRSMGIKVVVVSTTLNPADYPDVTVLSRGVAEAVAAMKAGVGKDIWLFGGGVLFRHMLDAGLVDSLDLAVVPVLLGSGIPLISQGSRCKMRLTDCTTLPTSGIIRVSYDVIPAPAN